MHLAGNADDGDAAVAGLGGRLQQRKQRREAHPHPAAGRHVRRAGHDDRARLPTVGRVRRDAQHRIDLAPFEQ
jgi:hypothetical protein